jgi:signal transduction histidine kinase
MSDADTVNILVVDDLPQKLLVYRTVLEDLGQNLITARSGEEALGLVLKHDFAVILLDVQLLGMDGFETANLIRRRKRSQHTPIIFLTAFADEVRLVEGYAHGAVDFILTPVVPEILRAKVRVFVDLYRMTQQVRRQAEERVALAEEKTKRAAAEEATRRSNFLAEVSRSLADSLDPDTTAKTLARQAVPFLADLAGVTLAGEHGQPWWTELVWLDVAGREHHASRLSSALWPRDKLRDAVEEVLVHGRPIRLGELDVAYPAPADQPASAEYRAKSGIILELRARGRTLGALTLVFGPSGRRHDPSEFALAEDLAGRAGIALDNARLYKDVERADRQKNEFLSMLAHELRNPLAPIRNAAEVLRLSGPEQPQVRWAREVIDRQLSHLVRLVDDLLDVSRITRGKITLKPEPTDLAVVVQHAIEASRPTIEQARHRLEVHVPPEPVWVTGDPARLTQVLTNLLNNAAKYTEEGGRVALTLAREGGEAVVRVRDTGVGIPAEMLGAVFDLFTQVDRSLDRSQGGLGIGLTLVKRLVSKHGGTVEAYSSGPGQGSEFVVRLPVLAEAPLTVPTQPTGRLAVAEGLRVLLVDDNVDGADSLATLVRLAGHDTRVAHDGPGALEAAAAFRPQVVVLDIGLPGLTGYEVARRLRADPDLSGVALVAVTGYGRDEDRERSREAGFDHHLTKPVEFALLLDLLKPPAAVPAGR